MHVGNRTLHIGGWHQNGTKQDIGGAKQDIGGAKQDIGGVKQDIEDAKQDIEVYDLFKAEIEKASLSKRSLQNLEKLYGKFGNTDTFGRNDIMKVLEITASPASELIKKLSGVKIIISVKGKGKGKYIFSK